MANFTLWSTLPNFYRTAGGPVDGDFWAHSSATDGGAPIWTETDTSATGFVFGQSATYNIVLTTQDWVGTEQPLITVATTTLIDPFGTSSANLGNLGASTIFSSNSTSGNGAVVYWTASTTPGDYAIDLRTFTTSYVTAPAPAGQNTTLTGSQVTLNAAVAKPLTWTFDTNYVGGVTTNLVVAYSTVASPTTQNIYFQGFNTAGVALTNSPTLVAAGVANGAFYGLSFNSSKNLYYYSYVQTGATNAGLYSMSFNPTTGAMGAASLTLGLPSAYSSIIDDQSVTLSSGNRLRFIEAIENGTQQVLQDYLGNGSPSAVATFNLTGLTADPYALASVYDPADGQLDYTVLTYTDNNQVHLELLDASGAQIGSDFIVPGITSFDRIHTLTGATISGATRVEIDYTVADPNGGAQVEGLIYDTTTAGYTYQLGAAGNNEYKGTPFNDTITDAAGTYYVDGGGGSDTFIVAYGSSQVTLSIDAAGHVIVTTPGGITTLARFTTITLGDSTVKINGNKLTQVFSDGSKTISNFNIVTGNYTSTVSTYNPAGVLESTEYDNVSGQTYTAYKFDFDGKTAAGAYNLTEIQYFYGAGSGFSEADYDGGGHLLAVYYNPPAGSAWTSGRSDYVDGQLADFGFTYSGPGGTDYASYTVIYNQSFQYTEAVFHYILSGQSYGFLDATVNAAGVVTELDYTNSTSGNASAPTEVRYYYDPVSGVLTGQDLSYSITGQAYTQLDNTLDASGKVTQVEFKGFTTAAYNDYRVTYSNGVEQYQIFGYDGQIGKSIGGAPYYAKYVVEDASGNILLRAYNLVNGGHVLNGTGNNLNFPTLGGVNNTFNNPMQGQLIPGGDFTIVGGGNNETFSFTSYFNQAEITDYGTAFGVATDVISVSTQDFANWQTMLGEAAPSGAGNINTTFTSATTGDKLTLDGVTVAQLTALTPSQANADFLFHA